MEHILTKRYIICDKDPQKLGKWTKKAGNPNSDIWEAIPSRDELYCSVVVFLNYLLVFKLLLYITLSYDFLPTSKHNILFTSSAGHFL